jgi:YhcH/YjgK/YiaL family protein
VVQRYRPKPPAEARWEAHRQYIDVQFLAGGVERIGYAPLGEALSVVQAYDAQKDVVFFAAAGDFVTVPAGSFAIFWPTDVHAPCLAGEASPATVEVCKVVVKCRVE